MEGHAGPQQPQHPARTLRGESGAQRKRGRGGEPTRGAVDIDHCRDFGAGFDDERSRPANRREDRVTDQAGARGVLEQEPVGPTKSERRQDPDCDRN